VFTPNVRWTNALAEDSKKSTRLREIYNIVWTPRAVIVSKRVGGIITLKRVFLPISVFGRLYIISICASRFARDYWSGATLLAFSYTTACLRQVLTGQPRISKRPSSYKLRGQFHTRVRGGEGRVCRLDPAAILTERLALVSIRNTTTKQRTVVNKIIILLVACVVPVTSQDTLHSSLNRYSIIAIQSAVNSDDGRTRQCNTMRRPANICLQAGVNSLLQLLIHQLQARPKNLTSRNCLHHPAWRTIGRAMRRKFEIQTWKKETLKKDNALLSGILQALHLGSSDETSSVRAASAISQRFSKEDAKFTGARR
jgi:hypothetical protein